MMHKTVNGTDSDDDENPSFTLKDWEEEEQDKEYMHTPETDKYDDENKMYEAEDDDVIKELRSECGGSATSNKLREEAQAENQEFLNQVDSTMKAIFKEHVQAKITKIVPQIEKYVIETLGAEVLVRSTNQP
uniref:Uncharacterized protein n=1 Tax=Tanacetum cinerariifolium TaxID=118510 RepID=A0A699QSP5_TANCI|nr:hypothetical protein [Tanacetum cinerariifolium]